MNAPTPEEAHCRCWADDRPNPNHHGHCCMREDGQTCHQSAGLAAFEAQEAIKAALQGPRGRALVQAIPDRKAEE